jgi:hypothetical protein
MKQFARWISIVAHPFSMITLLVAVPAMHQSSGHAALARQRVDELAIGLVLGVLTGFVLVQL